MAIDEAGVHQPDAPKSVQVGGFTEGKRAKNRDEAETAHEAKRPAEPEKVFRDGDDPDDGRWGS